MNNYPFGNPSQNIYPNIPSGVQYPAPPNTGTSNPQQRPFAPPPSQAGYPTQPNYPPQGNYGPGPSQPNYNPQPGYAPGINQPGYPPQSGYGPVSHQPVYPNQPNYGQQPQYQGYGGVSNYPSQPSFGYPSQNPGYQNYPNQGPSYGNQGYGANRWDERAYLKKMFDDMDHNHDGEISVQELHEALRRGQTNFEFDPFTVQFLVQKYDTNMDNEIGFNEFHDLYVGLNVQYNEFLDIDQDSSGFIDSRELANALRRKGFNFAPEIFDYIVNEISRRSGKRGITFDIYVRVIARFDHLRNEYNRMPYKNAPMELYIRDKFF